MGENHFPTIPVACYGLVLFLAGSSYYILVRVLLRHHRDAPLQQALGNDVKGKISLVAYLVAMPLAFVHTWLALGIYFAVAGMWFIPDRRIERMSE